MKRTARIFGCVAIVVTFAFGFITLIVRTRSALAVSRSDASPSGAVVKIDNFTFGPATVTIPSGTTITWTNHDDVPHVVVSDEKLFKSKALDTDDRYSFTFTKPGTYDYYCAIHPKMRAKVVVQ